MERFWKTGLLTGVLIVGCSLGAEDLGTPTLDTGEPVQDAELDSTPELQDSDSDSDSDLDPSDVSDTDIDSDSDIPDVEEDPWQLGDPAIGTGPFWPGTGRSDYEELLHGDPITWEQGIQGGHHIWVTTMADPSFIEDLDEDTRREIRQTYRFFHEDGELLAMASRTGGFRFQEETEQWLTLGLYAVLQAPRRPSTMDEEWILYQLEVEVDEQIYQRELWLLSDCCD